MFSYRLTHTKSTKSWLTYSCFGICCATLFIVSSATAQNVTGYGTMGNPHLFLIREPAVQAELELTEEQQGKLDALNARLDGPLLAARNKSDASERFDKLIAESEAAVAEFLSVSQRRRINQIRLRIRGWRSLLIPKVAERVGLSEEQQTEVAAAVAEHDAAYKELEATIESGEKTQAQAEVLAAEKLQIMQDRINEELTGEQTKTFLQLVGEEFPLDRLQQVTFEAPKFVDGLQWINSEPLTLEKLKGKVVALHFFAFAWINCIRNYPWYRDWDQSFADEEFTVVGIHTPETTAEREIDNLRREVAEAKLEFPVTMDEKKASWDRWGNSMWPSVYLIDRQGRVRYWWYGEMKWKGKNGQEMMKRRIEELLAEE